MKVKEFINKLEYVISFLENDELFGNMFEEGVFEDHSECYEDSEHGGCILCELNLPTRKITIQDLVTCEKDFKDYENSFYLAYENYMTNW